MTVLPTGALSLGALSPGALSIGAWIGGFVNPALLAGIGLAAVPIAIHLLNRQRHRPMPWAAMRFVLAAYKRTRRRVQLENLLLLLLRTAAIFLLALAITRPFAGDRSPLARLTESRRDVALIVDGSASTGYREGVDSVFEREIARAREILRGLDGARGDRVHLVLAGSYPRLLSWSNPAEALSVLDTLSGPTDEPMDLAAALTEVLKAVQEGSSTGPSTVLEIRLLSDLQRRSFAPVETAAAAPAGTPEKPGEVKPVRPALYEVLDRVSRLGLRVLVEDLGPGDRMPPNLSVASVATSGPPVGAGLPCEIRVEVQNHGATARHAARVTLAIDGASQPGEVLDLPARGRGEAVFSVSFKDAGDHAVEARLEGDRLSVDDTRDAILDVPPPLRVLLVDGAPAAAIDEDEIGYLRAALDPPVDDGGADLARAHPFDPREALPETLSTGETRFEDYDLVWLANVENLPQNVVDKLERAVGGGTSLVVSLGDRVTADAYDARLWRADGSGLLPAEILQRTAVPSRREGYFRVANFDAQCPALAFFGDERWKPLLTEVPIYEFFAVRPAPGARVLASLDDPGAHPLLVERTFDRGRVYLWTTSIDTAWTRLPESPRTLIPLAHELLRYAARSSGPPRNVAPGEPLAGEASSYPRNLVLVRPDGSRVPVDGVPEELPNGHWRLPVVPGRETEKAGLYKIEMEAAGSRAASLAFAVRMDASEGDLERAAPEELATLHPALVAVGTGDRGDGDADPRVPERGELWRGIALACLVAVVLETLWAAWIGRRRSA